VFTRISYWFIRVSLTWRNQSTSCPHVALRFIRLLSSHLRLGYISGRYNNFNSSVSTVGLLAERYNGGSINSNNIIETVTVMMMMIMIMIMIMIIIIIIIHTCQSHKVFGRRVNKKCLVSETITHLRTS
jgi:hypothetical protein